MPLISTETILNDIKETVSNLVNKHKTFSLVENATFKELQEIDKELGDCLNLLLSLDAGFASLTIPQINTILQDYQAKVDLLTQNINNALNSGLNTVTTALNAHTEQSTQLINTTLSEALTNLTVTFR
jgi:hypothetical protein